MLFIRFVHFLAEVESLIAIGGNGGFSILKKSCAIGFEFGTIRFHHRRAVRRGASLLCCGSLHWMEITKMSVTTVSKLSSATAAFSSYKQSAVVAATSPAIISQSLSHIKLYSNGIPSGSPNCRCGRKDDGRRKRERRSVQMSLSVSTEETATVDRAFADYKPSTAFFFPGQGAQAVGMGKDVESVPAAAALYSKATDILGYDLLDVSLNGPKEKLDSTVVSQPAIYVASLAAVEALRAKDGGQAVIDSVDVAAGLSLGEYTALAFAGAFSFEDGLKLVKLRGEAMQAAADAAPSAMASVIGLDSEKVSALCEAANAEVSEDQRVQIANFLCPGNYAVSGGVEGVEAVQAKSKAFKARMTVRLAVAGAFHTRFMSPAVSRLEAALAVTNLKAPRIPVISNVDGQPHSDSATIKKILAKQVTSPVLWENTVTTLLERGLQNSYELGPGKVIAGILKRIDKTASIENVSL